MTAENLMESFDRLPTPMLLREHPYAADFFTALGLDLPSGEECAADFFGRISPETLEDLGLERSDLTERFRAFMEMLASIRRRRQEAQIHSITIQGGIDKEGNPECLDLTVRPGEVVSIVGPTGSGKSRFLADIEWMAQGDTPTCRKVLVNGVAPDSRHRFSLEHKLVAQLSQNMNFVMDLTVEAFVAMHAESRMAENVREISQIIIDKANSLAGEPFTPDTPITALSGGQSRALMIADTSCLSSSPIILIDEIENAGIDRKLAVKTLVDREKIVFIATHDPVLALMSERRLVFRRGGVQAVIHTTATERSRLKEFEEMDAQLLAVRNRLRNGNLIM